MESSGIREVGPEEILNWMEQTAPCAMAALQHFRVKALRYIIAWAQQYRAPDADTEAIREQIEHGIRNRFDLIPERSEAEQEEDPKWGLFNREAWSMMRQESTRATVEQYTALCEGLAEYREQAVTAAFEVLRRPWIDGAAAEDKLSMMEGDVRAAVDSFDGRTRYFIKTLANMAGREGLLSFLAEIEEDVTDCDSLEEMGAEFTDDPQIGILVKMNDLLAQVDAGDCCAV